MFLSRMPPKTKEISSSLLLLLLRNLALKSKKSNKQLYSPKNSSFSEKNLIDWLDEIEFPY